MSSRGAFESVLTQNITFLLRVQLRLKECMQLCADGSLFGQVQNIWCWRLIVPLQRSLINTPNGN